MRACERVETQRRFRETRCLQHQGSYLEPGRQELPLIRRWFKCPHITECLHNQLLGEDECLMFKMLVSSGSHFRAFCDVEKEEWFDVEQSGGN